MLMRTKSGLYSIGVALLMIGVGGAASARQAPGMPEENTFLTTYYPLDEPRGYCIDIGGTGPRANLTARLQMHTCKYGRSAQDQWDQSFRPMRDGSGRIAANHYDRCLAAGAATAGAELFLQPCSDSSLQRWTMAWNRVSLASHPNLCLTVGAKGEPAGTDAWTSPINRSTTLTMEACSEAASPRQSWRPALPVERGLPVATVARAGMPPEVAAGLKALGANMGDDVVVKTRALYANAPRVYSDDQIQVKKDLAYGPHARHRLDVYTGTARRWPTPVPIVVFVHGGGFTGGSKEANAHVGAFFGTLGLVGVVINYRLAPEIKWPAGAEDVGAAVSWVKQHAAEFRGDPNKIFVMGISAGATHVADFVFRPELSRGAPAPAGAALVSGVYTFDPASDANSAYYGNDAARRREAVTLGHLTRTNVPVLITSAEFDPPNLQRVALRLVQELTFDHNVLPRFKQLLGHNHYSQGQSIGTTDPMLSSAVLDLVETTTGR
jgi:acetyl esterase/lipase